MARGQPRDPRRQGGCCWQRLRWARHGPASHGVRAEPGGPRGCGEGVQAAHSQPARVLDAWSSPAAQLT
eukprot:9848034-Alexandrium_andersonii.AAC.1